MKKTLLAFAVLGAFAGAASAQTNVTIFGLVDAGVVFERGGAGGSVTRLGTGISNGNRLGFKGVEDLGGGLSAKFHIENGFNADTGTLGQGGLLFGRQAWVGLQGGFGSVTMGRQWASHFLALDDVDPFDYSYAGAMSNLVVDGPFRINNSIKYAAPSMGGFTGELIYGFGEVPGSTSASRSIGGSAGYVNGPVYVKLAYNNTENATATNALKNTALAASYDFKMAKAAFAYNVNKNDVRTVDSNDMMLGVTVPFGPSSILASYIRKDDKRAANQDANQFALGYTYDVSKRTRLYTSYARISNKNGAAYTVGDATAAGSGDKALNFGIKHKF